MADTEEEEEGRWVIYSFDEDTQARHPYRTFNSYKDALAYLEGGNIPQLSRFSYFMEKSEKT